MYCPFVLHGNIGSVRQTEDCACVCLFVSVCVDVCAFVCVCVCVCVCVYVCGRGGLYLYLYGSDSVIRVNYR